MCCIIVMRPACNQNLATRDEVQEHRYFDPDDDFLGASRVVFGSIYVHNRAYAALQAYKIFWHSTPSGLEN
jgi:hypothetical protein